jgi:hypothetical protein
MEVYATKDPSNQKHLKPKPGLFDPAVRLTEIIMTLESALEQLKKTLA